MSKDKELLKKIASRPPVGRAWGYLKLTGPGILQSAMTLGAGSAAASVVAGASFGYKLLWVQPVAMFLGVMMFAALANIVLTTKERPYKGFMRELSIILVFLWALGSVMASVIWHFPQYGLAAGAARSIALEFAPTKPPVEDESLIKGDWKMVDGQKVEIQDNWKVTEDTKIDKHDWFGFGSVIIDKKTGKPEKTTQLTPFGYGISFGAGLFILLLNVTFVFNYGSGGIGIKIYEWFLRCMIGLVFLTFLTVVLLNVGNIQWLEIGKGFIGWYGVPGNDNPAEYAKTVTMVLGMIGAAVGINMTFMYGYSLLKKGWGEEHKRLAKWDLGLTMFLPFVVVTSLIMIGMTVSGIYDVNNVDGVRDVVRSAMQPLEAARALESEFISQRVATIIFCCGLFGMTCGAISAHMTCCGFVMCEMLGLDHTTRNFRIFALTPSIGFLGVVFQLPFWFPIAASAICLTMLPIAYLIFFVLNNKRSYIGAAVGRGMSREIFNVILAFALLMAFIGAFVKVKEGVYDKLSPPKVQQQK